MTQFKAGDRVQYSVTGGRNPLWQLAGVCGEVVSSADAVYGIRVRWDNGCLLFHNAEYLIKISADDPLPPAPESVRYYTAPQGINYLDVNFDANEIVIKAASDRRVFWNYLDPDSALELAHDLTRMAMQIKREQRAAEQS